MDTIIIVMLWVCSHEQQNHQVVVAVVLSVSLLSSLGLRIYWLLQCWKAWVRLFVCGHVCFIVVSRTRPWRWRTRRTVSARWPPCAESSM